MGSRTMLSRQPLMVPMLACRAGALRTHQVGHDHVEDRRGSAADDGPEHIGHRWRPVVVASAPSRLEQGAVEQRCRAGRRPVRRGWRSRSRRRSSCRHGIIVTAAQGTAHHTGTAHAEQVVDGIEGQQHRCRQGNGGILDGVIEHTYKVGIRQVVEHHDQRAENGGNRQCGDCFGNRGLFKEQGSVLLQGISSPEKSFRAPVFRALSRENRCALAIIILPYSGQSVKLEE